MFKFNRTEENQASFWTESCYVDRDLLCRQSTSSTWDCSVRCRHGIIQLSTLNLQNMAYEAYMIKNLTLACTDKFALHVNEST